jgi:PhzF family phenazine biosynthesis protein
VPRLQVTIVNACTRGGEGGSPTALLWEKPLSDAQRREVPRSAGTSHAVFVSRAGDEVSLRFFTAAGELPACGHGTIAALAFLAERDGGTDYRVHTAARSFSGSARRSPTGIRAEFDPGEVTVRDASSEEREAVLEVFGPGLGIVASEIAVGSTGRPRMLVPLADSSAVRDLKPDYERLLRASEKLGALGFYVHSRPASDGRVLARMFAPAIGVPEDIANANSTACLAVRLGRERISVEMGDALGAPARIFARVAAGQVRIGGLVSLAPTPSC